MCVCVRGRVHRQMAGPSQPSVTHNRCSRVCVQSLLALGRYTADAVCADGWSSMGLWWWVVGAPWCVCEWSPKCPEPRHTKPVAAVERPGGASHAAPTSPQQGLLRESPCPDSGGGLFCLDCLDVGIWAFDRLFLVYRKSGWM